MAIRNVQVLRDIIRIVFAVVPINAVCLQQSR